MEKETIDPRDSVEYAIGHWKWDIFQARRQLDEIRNTHDCAKGPESGCDICDLLDEELEW